MASLYDIDKRLLAYEEEFDPDTGEWLNEADLDAIKMERDEKIEQLLLWVKNLRAESDAIRQEAERLLDRAATATRKADGILSYVARELHGEKFKTPRVLVSWRKSERVEILNEDAVPERFLDISVVRKPIKKEIKKWLKEKGEDEPWAKIFTQNNIYLK